MVYPFYDSQIMFAIGKFRQICCSNQSSLYPKLTAFVRQVASMIEQSPAHSPDVQLECCQ